MLLCLPAKHRLLRNLEHRQVSLQTMTGMITVGLNQYVIEYFPKRKNSENASVLSSESTESHGSKTPASMPVPIVPRRAGPPRKKPVKPTAAVPDVPEEQPPIGEESHQPLEESASGKTNRFRHPKSRNMKHSKKRVLVAQIHAMLRRRLSSTLCRRRLTLRKRKQD